MRVEIGFDRQTVELFDRFLNLLAKMEVDLADALTNLEAEVATNTTVDGSIITLLQNIAATVSAADPNNQRIAAVLAILTANDARIAAAVVANTPVAPGSPATPPPPPPATSQAVAAAAAKLPAAAAAIKLKG